MATVEFGRLENFPLRKIWNHEAHDFTPWLADNIDHLSEAIGMPLELTGTEVAVESFSADILARNPEDDTVVLIENQLEKTDHTHLGQIMTYLSGLNAQTVIWIAPDFRAPHLTAIRWLNEHTSDGFSFFAIKARVVRIGDSPFAPVFEVMEKPDQWERVLKNKKREVASGQGASSQTRIDFWAHYANRHPQAAADGIRPRKAWNSYFSMVDGDILISVWIGEKKAGIFVRGGWGDKKYSAQELLDQDLEKIMDELGAYSSPNGDIGHIFGDHLSASYLDRNKWNEISDWMEERRLSYQKAICSALRL